MSKLETPTVHKSKEDKKKEWLNEEVLIEFFNLEEPGIILKFDYGPTNNTKKYVMVHGAKMKLKREIVNHIESRQTPIWTYKPNGQGQMEKALKGYKSRFQCRQVFE